MSDLNHTNLKEAKARLSQLVERARRGETVIITRRGQPVARIAPTQSPSQAISLQQLQAVTARQPAQAEPADQFIRRMREGERY